MTGEPANPGAGTSRQQQALDIFDALVRVPAAERSGRLRELCGPDEALEGEVAALLKADSETGPLELRVADMVAQQMRQMLQPDPSSHGGRYQILRVLGEGGMGTVYEAEQVHPRRRVALKAIRPGRLTPKSLRRFEHEAQILARLEHPGIARLYESDIRQGPGESGAFLAMELVVGVPIDQYVEDHRLPVAQRVALLVEVCHAVEHAHRMGIIHRDLKPANLLVDGHGKPKVLDFGVAHAADAGGDNAGNAGVTDPGQVVGTLNYMAPEQLSGATQVDTRCDVYSLGVILYRLLSGRLPVDVSRDSVLSAAQRLLTEAPAPLDGVPRDLEVVVLTALHKQPARRYDSVAALRADLQACLDGRPIRARADSRLYVVRKTLWRHRYSAVAAVAAVVTLATFAVYASLMARRNERLRLDVQAQYRETRGALYLASIGYASAALDANDIGRVHQQLQACPAELRSWEWSYLNAAADQSFASSRLEGGIPNVGCWSDDLSRVAHLSFIGRIDVSDAASGKSATRIAVEPTGARIALSPDGSRVAYSAFQDEVSLYAAGSGAPLWRRHIDGFARTDTHSMAFSTAGDLLAVAGTDGRASVLRAADGALLHVADAGGVVISAAFSPDGRSLYAIAEQHGAQRFSLDGSAGVEYEGSPDGLTDCNLSADGSTLVALSSVKGVAVVWRTDRPRPVASVSIGTTGALCSALSPDGKLLAIGSGDFLVRLFEVSSGKLVRSLRGHEATPMSMRFSAGGAQLASLGRELVAKRWLLDTPDPLRPLVAGAPEAPAQRCVFLTSGRDVFAVDKSGAASLYGGEGRQLARAVSALVPDSVTSVASHPSRRAAAISSFSPRAGSAITLVDPDRGAVIGSYSAPDCISYVAFTPDGRNILGVDVVGNLHVIEYPTMRAVEVIRVGDQGVRTVAVSPDSSLVAVGGEGGRVTLFRRQEGPLKRIGGAALGIYAFNSCDFSPDGRSLAVGGDEGVGQVLSVPELAPRFKLEGHRWAIFSLRYNPSGDRIITGSGDRTLRLWEAATGREILTLRGHAGVVFTVAVSRDGSAIASGATDGGIRLWSARP